MLISCFISDSVTCFLGISDISTNLLLTISSSLYHSSAISNRYLFVCGLSTFVLWTDTHLRLGRVSTLLHPLSPLAPLVPLLGHPPLVGCVGLCSGLLCCLHTPRLKFSLLAQRPPRRLFGPPCFGPFWLGVVLAHCIFGTTLFLLLGTVL